jgi:hypothetical protein
VTSGRMPRFHETPEIEHDETALEDLDVDMGHGNDSDIEGTHRGKLMQEPSLAAVGVH